jgi:hypothetical protein
MMLAVVLLGQELQINAAVLHTCACTTHATVLKTLQNCVQSSKTSKGLGSQTLRGFRQNSYASQACSHTDLIVNV